MQGRDRQGSRVPDPGRKVVEVDGVAVGVFCRRRQVHRLRERLPAHGRARLPGQDHRPRAGAGRADKTSLGLSFSKDQTNVACPWHGYEFDIATGQHQGNPRLRLRPVKIEVVDGDLVVTLPEGTRDRIARRARIGGSARRGLNSIHVSGLRMMSARDHYVPEASRTQ